MYSFLNKYGQTIAFVGGSLIVLLFFIIAATGVAGMGNPTREDLYGSGVFDLGLRAAQFLVIATLLLMAFFIIRSIVMNPKGSLPLIIGIVGILLLFLIFRGMASGEITAAMKKMSVNAGQGKFVSGGIWAATILFFGAIATAVISEVRGLFK